jgi:hypothetical protein
VGIPKKYKNLEIIYSFEGKAAEKGETMMYHYYFEKEN